MEYLSLILIIVYLGAVCVLFLFIIMMLNIKLIELKREINFAPFFFFLASLFLIYFFKNVFFFIFAENFFISLLELNSYFVTLFNNISSFFLDNHFYADDFFFLSYESSDPMENDFMKKIGLVLYTIFLYQFILSSLVLLVAMIGAIFITLEINLKSKKQFLYYQIKNNKGSL